MSNTEEEPIATVSSEYETGFLSNTDFTLVSASLVDGSLTVNLPSVQCSHRGTYRCYADGTGTLRRDEIDVKVTSCG